MANQQELFMQKVLRLTGNLPQHRYEIFEKLYVQGQASESVRQDMQMSADRFEEERRGLLRSLMRA